MSHTLAPTSPRTSPRLLQADVIRIDALGGLSVRGADGKPLAGAAAQPRRMAILALLARAGERGMRREKLLALLWPDADDERGPRALAQALYALRRDLGAEDAIVGAKELRLDPGTVSSDVGECAAALARGDDARAVALYRGPFLDGFHLPGLDSFARWVEDERRQILNEHARALESLARQAKSRGDAPDAVIWWRKLAAHEPLNARVAVGLMEALDAAGDRAGAIKHAHVYQLLVEQELDLPPDREVLALAERLRQAKEVTAPPVPRPAPPPPAPNADVPQAPTVAPSLPPVTSAIGSTTNTPRRSSHWRAALAVAGLVAIVAIAFAITRGRSGGVSYARAANGGTSVVAIGHIVAFEGDTVQAGMAAAVADLLTTSLARVPSIRVVSHGRMLELMRVGSTPVDTSAGAFVDAARQAGASEVIDGTLHARPGGRLRLDVRRVDLASGAIDGVHTVEGNDLFALVDSGTTWLVHTMGIEAPAGSVADVTTRSVPAYRMYERGVDAYYRGDTRAALALFDGALEQDSMFALAAYYGALAAWEAGFPARGDSLQARITVAKRLAARAPDRERLVIMADWANRTSSPTLRQLAESLVVRYPAEVEGHLYSGLAHVTEGDFLAAIAPLERAIATDSFALLGAMARCSACEALGALVRAYHLADSLPAAVRTAERWVRLEPRSTHALQSLLTVLFSADRGAEASAVYRKIVALDSSQAGPLAFTAPQHIRAGDYAAAYRLLIEETRRSDAAIRRRAYWQLAISLRQQGRLDAAFDATREMRRVRVPGIPSGLAGDAILEAQVQLERGHPRIAAALFDSLARTRFSWEESSVRSRRMVWALVHAGGARIAAGDTARFDRLIDSVRALGIASGFGRDRRLYHHLRGALLAARGDTAAAISELRAASYSLTLGYTRTNLLLGALYLQTDRPRESIAVLQAALRAPLDGSNLYASRTELHELLARAWDAAGSRDSAAAHYAIVAKDWSAGDSAFASRATAARARVAALGRTR